MKPLSIFLTALVVLAACSSGPRDTVTSAAQVAAPTVHFATGPIYSACRQAGRAQASRERCGCVQAVANRALDAGDQRRGASFFQNPQEAQEVRQSDRAIDERFWTRWRVFGDEAARFCT